MEVTSKMIIKADGTTDQNIRIGTGIKTPHIQNGAVTKTKIRNESITSSKICKADGTTGQNTSRGFGIKTRHIQDGAISKVKLRNDAVSSVKIRKADGTTGQDTDNGAGIKTPHIQDGAVTFDKISNDVQQKFENVESAAKAYADELLVGHTHIKGDISIDGVLTGNIKKTDKPSAIDLSLTNVIYLDYREANVGGDITVLNGVPGTVYYLIVKSNGIHYKFTNVKWPSGIDPIPSADGKRDMYSFICIGPDDYLGTFAFNYD